MTETKSNSTNVRQLASRWVKWSVAAVVCGTAVAAVAAVDRGYRSAEPVKPAIETSTAKLDQSSCRECHADIVEKFVGAPHASTLHRGDAAEMLEAFGGKSLELSGQRFEFVVEDGQLFLTNPPSRRRLSIDWVFGSGQHARTPVSIDSDPAGRPRLTQSHVSLLAAGRPGKTPGSTLQAAASGEVPPSSMGIHAGLEMGMTSNANDTRRCFGCHVSYLPVNDGRIDLDHLVPNLNCMRCHPGAAEHAESGGDRLPDYDWSEFTPLQAINRCGECHRRVDEFTPDEVLPELTHLVRFAPVGMAMSRCFVESQLQTGEPIPAVLRQRLAVGGSASSGKPDEATASHFPRFDCVTCHDPHSPATSEVTHYNRQCLQCHQGGDSLASESSGGAHGLAASCTAAPMTSSCVECHMPKIGTKGLKFTDHWIRVHDDQTDPTRRSARAASRGDALSP